MKKSIKITLIITGTLLIIVGIIFLVAKSNSEEIDVNVYAISEVEIKPDAIP